MKAVKYSCAATLAAILIFTLTPAAVFGQEVTIGMEIGPLFIFENDQNPNDDIGFIQRDDRFSENDYFYPDVAACGINWDWTAYPLWLNNYQNSLLSQRLYFTSCIYRQ